MSVLVVNCGSSSVKAAVVDPADGRVLAELLVERVGKAGVSGWCDTGDGKQPLALLPEADHDAVLAVALPRLLSALDPSDAPTCVGHRAVHGGPDFDGPTLVDDDVLAAIEALVPLAPLHNPANLAGVRAARAVLPDLPHVVVFDTAFHASIPERAHTYALPLELSRRHGIRRYGFHGTSHAYVAGRAAAWLGEDPRSLRVITCHLGNGASVAAVEYGRSVETSMGLTPLEGLVMGTRSGDVDPAALIMLMRAEGLDADGLDTLLNRQSGLAGLSGGSSDMRDIEGRAAEGDARAQLAIQVFSHRVRKYIGAYAAVMGGVDAIVFTGGIGENSALVRQHAASRLDFLGARLDEVRNRDAQVDDEEPIAELSADNSRVRILAVHTDEQHQIAREAAALVAARKPPADLPTIPIAISARHIHLTEDAVAALFGPGHQLTPLKPLSQPGQYAAEETLTVHGPKRSIQGVRVLGPTRRACQVEVSRTDEFYLGLDAPVRQSGDVAGTPGITLEGPAGRLTIPEGVICAWRHIHMTPADAQRFGVEQGDLVEVAVDSDGRDLTFGDVMVRVSEKYALEMHVDTDEANAAELRAGHPGALVDSGGRARVLRKQGRALGTPR